MTISLPCISKSEVQAQYNELYERKGLDVVIVRRRDHITHWYVFTISGHPIPREYWKDYEVMNVFRHRREDLHLQDVYTMEAANTKWLM